MTADCGTATAGLQQPHQHVERSGFASAAGAKQAKALTTCNCQAQRLNSTLACETGRGRGQQAGRSRDEVHEGSHRPCVTL